MKKLFYILVIALVVQSCYYDKENILYTGNTNCDTTNITYNLAVRPVLTVSCTGCHSGAGASAGIALDNYNTVKTLAVNGKLYGTISHSAGYSPMPKGGGKLSNCDISKIKKWIDSGSLNN